MPLILPGNVGSATAAVGFNVANSCRFNDGSSDNLSKTNASGNSDMTKFTVSFWFKKTIPTISNGGGLFLIKNASNNTADKVMIYFLDDKINCFISDGSGGTESNVVPNRLFRDTSAWTHITYRYDSTQGTDSNRVRLYINGVQETSLATANYPDQNHAQPIDNSTETIIGKSVYSNGNAYYYDGYMNEVLLVDNQSLAPTNFGEFDEDSGIWKPIKVSGLTFGDGGFLLDFQASANLGNDANGGTDFTENNLTAIDQSTDTCTNNFATLNPLDGNLGDSLFTEGNLKFDTNTGSNKPWSRSTIGVSSGKWYFEAKLITAANNQAIGISDRPSPDHNSTELGAGAFDYSYQSANSGDKYNNGSQSSYGNTYGANDIVSCALDLDNLKVYFGKNGTFQNSGDPTSGATGTGAAFTITAPSLTNHGFYFFCLADLTGANKSVWEANFGSPSFAISSGNTDGNGYGNFEYAVPSGYFALNTKNLAEYG